MEVRYLAARHSVLRRLATLQNNVRPHRYLHSIPTSFLTGWLGGYLASWLTGPAALGWLTGYWLAGWNKTTEGLPESSCMNYTRSMGPMGVSGPRQGPQCSGTRGLLAQMLGDPRASGHRYPGTQEAQAQEPMAHGANGRVCPRGP
jgi:hypothetical protein